MRTIFLNLLLIVVCLYLAGCADLHGGGVGAGSERRSFQQITDDAKITSNINTEYFKEELIHTIRIDVDTHRGVVTLKLIGIGARHRDRDAAGVGLRAVCRARLDNHRINIAGPDRWPARRRACVCGFQRVPRIDIQWQQL